MAAPKLDDDQVRILKAIGARDDVTVQDVHRLAFGRRKPDRQPSPARVRQQLRTLARNKLVKAKPIKGHPKRANGYALMAAGRKAIA